MPRSARMLFDDGPATYHVMSHAALDGHPLGAVEKDYLVSLIRRFAELYFVNILGFCIMGNHFHLLVRIFPGSEVSDEEVLQRFKSRYGEKAEAGAKQLAELRNKWSSLSEFVGEVKQTFSRYYNKVHKRRGYFWGDRFKSVLVEDGRTLVNCLAYIDLNPVRAGLVARPEDYRWCSLAYHVQRGNADSLLSMDFGLAEWGIDESERLTQYRGFLYELGAMDRGMGTIPQEILEKERSRDFRITAGERFMQRCRYFTDSGVIGSRRFVQDMARRFGLRSAVGREPKMIPGLEGSFSLRHLSET